MKHLVWVGLIAVVVAAPVALAPNPASGPAPAGRQDVMAMTEQELLELNARMEQIYLKFLAQKADRKALGEAMKKMKYDLKKRNWDVLGGDAKIRAALQRLSEAMYERAHWLQPQGSAMNLAKDTVNWDRIHDVEIALLNLRLAKLERK